MWKRPGEIFISQGKYILKLLERFGMNKWNSMTTLMEMNFKKLHGKAVVPDLENSSKYRKVIGT